MELPGDGPSGHQFSAETFKTLYLNGGGVFPLQLWKEEKLEHISNPPKSSHPV